MNAESLRAIRQLFARFKEADKGAIAPIFGVLLVTLLAGAGFAVDASNIYRARAVTQKVADAAALAGAQSLNRDPGARANIESGRFLDANKASTDWPDMTQTVSVDSANRKVTVVTSVTVRNYFGAFVGRPREVVRSSATAEYGVVPPIEIAIAFDVTGSMKYRGDGDSDTPVSVPKPDGKGRQAQRGLKKFLEKLADLTDVKAALVPFATVVKVDADSTRYESWLDWSASSVHRVPNKSTWEGCIVDRDKDVLPFVSQHSMKYPATTCRKDMWSAVRWTGSKSNDIVRSSSDLDVLKSRIDGLQFDGCTNITLGAYWGGVMLDPQGPVAGAAGWNERKKILLLMSDGMNTTDRWTPIPDAGECARKTSMDSLTIATCDAIKAKNIEIYTVNVVNGDPTVLKACASGPDHYFYSSSAGRIAEDLETVTEAIKKLAIVRVTK